MAEAHARSARPGPRQQARTLSYLFMGGSVLGLATLAFLPLPAGTDVPGTLVAIAISLPVCLVLFLYAGRLPGWTIPLALAFGTGIISLDIYFAGDIRTNDEMFYLWVAFYAFYFLPSWVAVGELALVAAGFALAIALRGEPDGSTRWVITMGTLALAGLLTTRLMAQLDRWVQRSNARERALRQAEERFRSAFDNAAIGMALVDLTGRFQQVNGALARLTGYPAAELVGMTFGALTLTEDLSGDLHALAQFVSGDLNVYQTEKRYRRADGGTVWVSLNVSLVRDADGNPVNLISQIQDITDQKAAERELAERALHDPLTGLPNRILFLDRVEVALSRMERSGAPVAVFFIDVDRFKLVNDSLGHSFGDRMLVEVAARLRGALRPEDTVCRFGGDEFTILGETTDELAAKAVAERILGSMAEPFVIDGRELFAAASLGVSICRDPRVGAEGVLRDADMAMYEAKGQGGSRLVVFEGGMRPGVEERLELEDRFGLGEQPSVVSQRG